jgi:hypothetical protein
MQSTAACDGFRVLSLTLTLPDSNRRSTVANSRRAAGAVERCRSGIDCGFAPVRIRHAEICSGTVAGTLSELSIDTARGAGTNDSRIARRSGGMYHPTGKNRFSAVGVALLPSLGAWPYFAWKRTIRISADGFATASWIAALGTSPSSS